MPHPDVAAEQAHVDHSYQRLDSMRAAVAGVLHDAFAERGGTFQSLTERDIRVRNSLARLGQLEIGGEALVFGRIDRASDGTPNGEESFHIGRLAVSDLDQEPLVVDWRAPVAEPFYRATGAHPMGLRRRRHFLTHGRRVIDLEDEFFDDEGSGTGSDLGISGPGVLRSALERSRSGRMRDIVATVQREQDEVIRGPLAGIVVVQGGPGTGKTAVALHRAAYLLYTHRFPLERQGVLVVGPNPVFLRYIEHVLPSLGETGVELSTVPGLYGHVAPSGTEPNRVRRLKGDGRMAALLARAVADRQRPLRRAVEVPYGRFLLKLTPEASAAIVNAVKRRAGAHNPRRRLVETLVWRHLLDGIATSAADDQVTVSERELGRALRRLPQVAEALDRMWPVLSAPEFLHDLFGAQPLLDLAGRRLLDEDERRLLHRPRAPSLPEVRWTTADMALLDEAAALLGPVRRSPDRATPAYGHIVVDEAQDLSPMELRMLARRSISGSMTVVGDIAQGTGEWATRDWSEVVRHLPARKDWRAVELTVNYRTPSEIMAVAGPVLEAAEPGLVPPIAIRHNGHRPRVIPAPTAGAGGPRSMTGVLTATVEEESAAVTHAGDKGGTVAVIVPPSLVERASVAFDEGGLPYGKWDKGALDSPITLLTVEQAKGLEFDAVVVAEPALMVAEAPKGLRALYVALTRATQRLAIVHSAPLPAVLAEGVAAPGACDHRPAGSEEAERRYSR